MVAEDDVTARLAAELRPSALHLFQHVSVADARLDDLDSGPLHRANEAEVRHDRPHDDVAGQRARLLHGDGARRHDLIAVDHLASSVGEERAVGVTVQRHAGVGTPARRLGRDDLRVQGPASGVDVPPVRVGTHHLGFRAEPREDLRAGEVGRAVGAVEHDLEPVQPGSEGALELTEVIVWRAMEDAYLALTEDDVEFRAVPA